MIIKTQLTSRMNNLVHSVYFLSKFETFNRENKA